MGFFIAQNPGLASRFRTTIEFADYTDEELVGIFRTLADRADYDVSNAVEARFRELLAHVERGPSFGNGRYARNTFEGAIGRQAWRLRETVEPTVEQLRGLEPDDLGEVNPLTATEPVPPQPEPAVDPAGEDAPPGGDVQNSHKSGAHNPAIASVPHADAAAEPQPEEGP
jgi:hypothetical protein